LTPTPREEDDERFSVERFVCWMFHDVGTCPLVAARPLEQVPGYQISLDPHQFEPLAWECHHVAPDGTVTPLHVMWSIDASIFSLYRNGALISERPSEAVI